MAESTVLVDKFGESASGFGSKLDKLEIVSTNPACTIPKHCPPLLELNVCYGEEFDEYDAAFINRVIEWYNVGSKVERLILCGVSIYDGELARIRKHRSKLKYIGTFSKEGENIAKVIAFYGDQLRAFSICQKSN